MKKHELLEKSMRDYPAGTKFQWDREGSLMWVSTGMFRIEQSNGGNIYVECVGGYEYGTKEARDIPGNMPVIFDSKIWAPIMPAEPEKTGLLDGKVAIQVNNEREFKLLMEHYDGNGWRAITGGEAKNIKLSDFSMSPYISYNDCFNNPNDDAGKGQDYKGVSYDISDYKIIPFADFAAFVGIEMPAYIMDSEDGVPLYDGDSYYRTCDVGGKGVWTLITIGGSDPTSGKLSISNGRRSFNNNTERIFSTKEAALKWIAEQNKPKEVTIGYGCNTKAVVRKDVVKIYLMEGEMTFDISADQLHELYAAMEGLQS